MRHLIEKSGGPGSPPLTPHRGNNEGNDVGNDDGDKILMSSVFIISTTLHIHILHKCFTY